MGIDKADILKTKQVSLTRQTVRLPRWLSEIFDDYDHTTQQKLIWIGDRENQQVIIQMPTDRERRLASERVDLTLYLNGLWNEPEPNATELDKQYIEDAAALDADPATLGDTGELLEWPLNLMTQKERDVFNLLEEHDLFTLDFLYTTGMSPPTARKFVELGIDEGLFEEVEGIKPQGQRGRPKKCYRRSFTTPKPKWNSGNVEPKDETKVAYDKAQEILKYPPHYSFYLGVLYRERFDNNGDKVEFVVVPKGSEEFVREVKIILKKRREEELAKYKEENKQPS